jgi:circadian clock protein KaiC
MRNIESAGPDCRLSTGIPGLDRLMGGGLIAGRPYLIQGGPGSGKTLLALRFLLEGVQRGEPVLLVAVDEPPTEIMENVVSFGWDLSQIHTLDANPAPAGFRRLGDIQEIRALHDVRSMQDLSEKSRKSQASDEVSIQSIFLKVRKQAESVRFRRVVIDSMTSLRQFTLRQGLDLQAERTEIQSLLRFLTEIEATAIITTQPSPSGDLTPEEVLARGVVSLERRWEGPSLVRTLRVTRMRGTPHDPDAHLFTIGPDAIRVEAEAAVGRGP